jgi:hypothetical protein
VLIALELIQAEVFGRLGLAAGSYATFAVRVENLMLPPTTKRSDQFARNQIDAVALLQMQILADLR